MASPIDTPPPDFTPRADSSDLARLAGLWLLGLAGIYLSYGWIAGLGLEGNWAFLERAAMIVGPSTVAFALLISPALFAASVAQTGELDRYPGRLLARRWTLFALFAGVAFLLSTLSATIATSQMSPVVRDPAEAFPISPPPTLALTRHLISISLAAFVPIAGIAGILIGHVTNWWHPYWCTTVRWVSGLALMASYLIPFLATANAIAQHGTSPVWIIVNPLALPLILTLALAVRERDALGLGLGAWWRRTDPNALDPEALERIVDGLAGDPDSRIDPRDLTGPEREVATLVTMMRRIAGPRAKLSESRVRKIVTALVEASPASAPETESPRRSWLQPSVLGGFCTSWTCLAAGLLIVSPLGGVPISVASAAVVGFLGSAGIFLVARRFPGLAVTVPT